MLLIGAADDDVDDHDPTATQLFTHYPDAEPSHECVERSVAVLRFL